MKPLRVSMVALFAALAWWGGSAVVGRGAGPRDPLAAELERWAAFIAAHPAGDENWKQVRDGSEPALAAARGALAAGRRLMALSRLAAVRTNLSAIRYTDALRAAGPLDSAALEREWARFRKQEVPGRDELPREALARVRPAAVRALGETFLPQVKVFHEASLDYGRNTAPEYGLFYLGSARAAEEFVSFARTLREPARGSEPDFRPLGGELDSLGREMLAAYRPPLSIDHHPEFIVAHAALKEARELDAAGLRRGALVRHLQASLRFAPLRPAAPAPDSAALARRLAAWDRRLAADGRDHSIARMFLEMAASDAGTAGSSRATAAAIDADALPRYFRAIGAAPAPPAPPVAQVAITLVRWPYT